MKPDWKDAPKWAKFLAMDSTGDWYWYEFEPELQSRVWRDYSGNIELALRNPQNWETTLEGRPE